MQNKVRELLQSWVPGGTSFDRTCGAICLGESYVSVLNMFILAGLAGSSESGFGWGCGVRVLDLRAWISAKQSNAKKGCFSPRSGSLLLQYEIHLFWYFKQISNLTSSHFSEHPGSKQISEGQVWYSAETVTGWRFSRYLYSLWEC